MSISFFYRLSESFFSFHMLSAQSKAALHYTQQFRLYMTCCPKCLVSWVILTLFSVKYCTLPVLRQASFVVGWNLLTSSVSPSFFCRSFPPDPKFELHGTLPQGWWWWWCCGWRRCLRMWTVKTVNYRRTLGFPFSSLCRMPHLARSGWWPSSRPHHLLWCSWGGAMGRCVAAAAAANLRTDRSVWQSHYRLV